MTSRTIVFEDAGWIRLLPLVYMRGVFELRCGRSDLLSRIGALAGRTEGGGSLEISCRPQLADLIHETTGLPVNRSQSARALLLNGRGLWKSLPDETAGGSSWVGTVGESEDVACVAADAELAASLTPETVLDQARLRTLLAPLPRRDVSENVQLLDWPWNFVHANAAAMESDWDPAAAAIHGQVDEGSYLLAPEHVHIGAGSRVKPCTVIDAESGPVWIGENVTINPHCYIEGPVVIESGTILQPGAKIREGTTLGPRCKVGGEIEASIVQGFSNKQHDGFLGHSYVGEWVNIAADCINSDLKNTYGMIRVPINGREVNSGEMFVGMVMGDYSKAGINVSFPTGAVVGFSSSVIRPLSPKFVPSFAWIDGDHVQRFDVVRGLAVARKVMARRQREVTPAVEHAFLQVREWALALEHEQQIPLETGRHDLDATG
ncbi:UDP-N-acetylglucosamine acyltransferase [Maioricimonas rarisocia]|uniref:UDP-N-acetylglucosamine acyltransferase n=1 Tax=Maioricimonas rarisocia TaxID=2528026 RepID=A0A517Z8Z5_9PLAN|nr:putative sugar nucleotidyl transferase [Maioricimonas rarisocia]QDU38960.1 UDP-N-acetylglucosamine acyltransferase [Maioricimonas rarisocia]